jgi:hypothetical protein
MSCSDGRERWKQAGSKFIHRVVQTGAVFFGTEPLGLDVEAYFAGLRPGG